MILAIVLALQELKLDRVRTEERLAVTLSGRERLTDGSIVKVTVQPLVDVRGSEQEPLLDAAVDEPVGRSFRARIEQGQWTGTLKYRAVDLPPGRLRVTIEAEGQEPREEVRLVIGPGESYLAEEVKRLDAALRALEGAAASLLKLEDEALTAGRTDKFVAEVTRTLEVLMSGATASPIRRTIARLFAMQQKLHLDLANGIPPAATVRTLVQSIESELGVCRRAMAVELNRYVRSRLADVCDQAAEAQARAFCRALRDGHAQGARVSESYAALAEGFPDLLDCLERLLETRDEALRQELRAALPVP